MDSTELFIMLGKNERKVMQACRADFANIKARFGKSHESNQDALSSKNGHKVRDHKIIGIAMSLVNEANLIK